MQVSSWWAAVVLGLALVSGAGEVRTAAADAAIPLPPTPPAAVPATHDLPAVLSKEDAGLYRRMFDLGEPGRWEEVDRLVEKLDDRVLMGHVLAQRYLHPTKYRTPFHELRAWMELYHDHPEAERMYRLAQQRRPSGGPAVRQPTYTRGHPSVLAREVQRANFDFVRPRGSSGEARRILAQVRRNVLDTRLTITEELLARSDVRAQLTPGELGWALAEVASGWYFYGNHERALAAAKKATARRETAVPMARWYAGLAAWRLDEMEEASRHFSALAESEHAPGARVAAGGYWAARAHLRLRQPQNVSRFLRKAGAFPRTFYGLLALQALGVEQPLQIDDERAREKAAEKLRSLPAGRRALALLQVGELDRAKQEFLGVEGWDDPEMVDAVLLMAERGGLAAFAFDLANRLGDDPPDDWPQAGFNAALFPVPPWRPSSGFHLDRALIFALMRQESGFDPQARSRAGARGLMQIMPGTADYIARINNLHYSRSSLDRPDLNLDLAQRYISYLLNNGAVEEDLINLIAAYNGGPGNLLRWRRELGLDEDPLLFIESLPSSETRMFIERVLTNLWIYRKRLNKPASSLVQIAAGAWPRYESTEDVQQELAQQ